MPIERVKIGDAIPKAELHRRLRKWLEELRAVSPIELVGELGL